MHLSGSLCILLMLNVIDVVVNEEDGSCSLDIDLAKDSWKRVSFSAPCPSKRPSICRSLRRIDVSTSSMTHGLNIVCGLDAKEQCSVRPFDVTCTYDWLSTPNVLIQDCCCHSVIDCQKPILVPFSRTRKPILALFDYFQSIILLGLTIAASMIVHHELCPMIAFVMRHRFLVQKSPLASKKSRVPLEHFAAALSRHHIPLFRSSDRPFQKHSSFLMSPRINVQYVAQLPSSELIEQQRYRRLIRTLTANQRKMRTRVKNATEWHRSDLRRMKRENQKVEKKTTSQPYAVSTGMFNPMFEQETQHVSEQMATANQQETSSKPRTATLQKTRKSLKSKKQLKREASNNSKRRKTSANCSTPNEKSTPTWDEELDKTPPSEVKSDSTQPLDDGKTEGDVAKFAIEQTSDGTKTSNASRHQRK